MESVLAFGPESDWFSNTLSGPVVWIPHWGDPRLLPWDEHPHSISTQELLACLAHLPSPKGRWGWGSQTTPFPARIWCETSGGFYGVTTPSVTSFLLTVLSSCACSFLQHKITEDFSELLDDIKTT